MRSLALSPTNMDCEVIKSAVLHQRKQSRHNATDGKSSCKLPCRTRENWRQGKLFEPTVLNRSKVFTKSSVKSPRRNKLQGKTSDGDCDIVFIFDWITGHT